MTIYNSSPVSLNQQVPSHGIYGDMKAATASVTTGVAVTTADTFNLMTLPKNAVVWGFECKCTQMDTNGAPTLAFNVGDINSPTRLFAATPQGRTSVPQYKNETDASATHTGVGFQTTALTTIFAQPSTNPATGAAGTFTFNIYYTLVGGPS